MHELSERTAAGHLTLCPADVSCYRRLFVARTRAAAGLDEAGGRAIDLSPGDLATVSALVGGVIVVLSEDPGGCTTRIRSSTSSRCSSIQPTSPPTRRRGCRGRGGEIRSEFVPLPGDVVALEHWCSSRFANTDLDLQLKEHDIERLIVIGLIATTCVDSTVRFAAGSGYDVTVVRDAIADLSHGRMHAALDVAIPNRAQDSSGRLPRPVAGQT